MAIQQNAAMIPTLTETVAVLTCKGGTKGAEFASIASTIQMVSTVRSVGLDFIDPLTFLSILPVFVIDVAAILLSRLVTVRKVPADVSVNQSMVASTVTDVTSVTMVTRAVFPARVM